QLRLSSVSGNRRNVSFPAGSRPGPQLICLFPSRNHRLATLNSCFRSVTGGTFLPCPRFLSNCASIICLRHEGDEFSMSLSARIAPHLPYLRRFARAVSGSQTSGDALVA